MPKFLGRTTVNTASMMGEIGEVNDWLLENKYIKANQSVNCDNSKTRYYNPYNNFYKINEI